MAKKRVSAATRQRQLTSIVSDRVSYLRSIAKKTITFKTATEAKAFAKRTERETGITYRTKGNKASLQKIDRDNVKSSSELRRILGDLKSRSKSARGKKARALQELGRRETWYDFAIGDTNE